MVYGEGKKVCHRLQLEIIRMSNDQSIFAWGCRSRDNLRNCSILADDPNFFRGCSSMVPMVHDKFIQELSYSIPEEELPSIEGDHRSLAHTRSSIVASKFGCFSVLTRALSVFQAWSPRCFHASGAPVTINTALYMAF